MAELLRRGVTVDAVSKRSKVDPWFLENLRQLVEIEEDLRTVAPDESARWLRYAGCAGTALPATATTAEVLAHGPVGVFLSNGPGDPAATGGYAVPMIKGILAANLPVFGICLGHQLLGLASGAKTVKMKFGHHGANHPVVDLETKAVAITSQNHGFAVDEDSLPDTLRPTHRSLFDDSLQGIERTDCLAMGFQGHPEASPGPHDLRPIFHRFIEMMREKRTNAATTA